MLHVSLYLCTWRAANCPAVIYVLAFLVFVGTALSISSTNEIMFPPMSDIWFLFVYE